MAKYLCWRADLDQDPEEDGEVYEGYDAARAAEKFCDEHFADWSYPRYIDVRVRSISTGQEYDVNVDVEHVPAFHGCAKEREAKNGGGR